MTSMGLTYWLEKQLLNAALLGHKYQGPETLYLALFRTNPGKDESGEEIDAPSYKRRAITFDGLPNGIIRNSNEVSFPKAEEDWGWVGFAAIFDAHEGGRCHFFGPIDEPTEIFAEDEPTLLPGAVEILWTPPVEAGGEA